MTLEYGQKFKMNKKKSKIYFRFTASGSAMIFLVLFLGSKNLKISKGLQ